MARLPQPGGDSGNWGDILNDYLATSHKSDGTIKDNSIGSAQLQDNAVTAAALAPNSVTGAALAADSVTATTIADGSITEPLLASAVQTKLNAPAAIADGSVTNTKIAADSVSKNQLQPVLRDELDAKLTKAVGDSTYAPVGDYASTSVVRRSLIRTPSRVRKAMVAFVMDDNPAEDVTVIKPILDAKGVKGSFAIVTGTMWTEHWGNYRALQVDGHEILNHSVTHANLSTAADAIAEAEIRDADTALRANGLIPAGLVWPLNVSKKYSRTVARDLYPFALAGANYPTPAVSPFSSYSIGRVGFTSVYNDMKAEVDLAVATDGFLVFQIHSNAAQNWTAARTQNLSDIIDYIQSLGVPITTVASALEQVGNILDLGDRESSPYVTVSSDGNLSYSTNEGLPLRAQKQFFSGSAEITLSFALGPIAMYKNTIVELTLMSQRYYNNAIAGCTYERKMYIGVGANEAASVRGFETATQAGFTTAPVVTVSRNTTTGIVTLTVVFTQSDADANGIALLAAA